MRRSFLITLYSLPLFVGLFFASDASAAGRVFYDGWESGNANAWVSGGTGIYGKCDVVTSALDGGVGPLSGTKMARCNWDGTAGPFGHQNQAMAISGWSKSREMLIRFWTRVDSDVDVAKGAKLFRGPGGTSYSGWQFEEGAVAALFSALFKSNAQSIGSANYGCSAQPGYNYDPPIRNGNWHQIEIYLKESTSGSTNGEARIWVDDKLCWEALNQNTDDPLGPSYWADFHVMSNWSLTEVDWAHDANNHIYWDDFEVYSDTGTGGTGTLSAGTMTQGSTDTTRRRLRRDWEYNRKYEQDISRTFRYHPRSRILFPLSTFSLSRGAGADRRF
ncbi:MAG: hypothetical protein IPJ68_00135 [Candidatus Moraniibacteriota bacterium]|nr:MAG: hypothetical protein IPJ68_00135 [Candidatus Moranbacteria bacterium]